jgi:hypothetical protein
MVPRDSVLASPATTAAPMSQISPRRLGRKVSVMQPGYTGTPTGATGQVDRGWAGDRAGARWFVGPDPDLSAGRRRTQKRGDRGPNNEPVLDRFRGSDRRSQVGAAQT